MATSSDQATHLDIASPSDIKTAAAHTETHDGEIHNQENTLDSDPSPVMPKVSAPDVEKPISTQEQVAIEDSTDVKTATLGSPFPSPKLVAEDNKSVASLEDGEIIEQDLDGGVGASPVTVQEQQERIDEKPELKLASPIAKKEAPLASPPGLHVEATNTDVDIGTEDSDFKTDTDANIEAPKPSRPAHSLPPHMRPDFQSPPSRLFGLPDPRHMMSSNEVNRFNDAPRAPRSHFNSHGSRGGDHGDREQIVRMNAQVMKLKNELDAERNKGVRLRKSIEAEQQQKVEAASSVMLTNLLRDQATTLTLKSKVEARERDLDEREQKITQLEVYLTEGQKQLMYALEENGDRPMSAVQMEHARREAELNAQRAMADMNGKLNIKIEALRLREAAQQMREQNWKAIAREQLEAEFADNSITHEKADEVAEEAYNDGFGAGKEAGHKEALKESHQRGFLEGYGACHRTQVALCKMRQGLIARDDPELDFLYDANHPHNLWNIGQMVGRLEKEDKTALTKEDAKKETSVEKKILAPVQGDDDPEETSRMNRKIDGRMNGHTSGHTDGNINGHNNGINSNTNGTMIHKREEPAIKMPPPRPTFAAELRGPSLTHNGHIVLANNVASPVAKETGRPIIKYEDEGVNLIDLM
ncbi:uncharacterized protein J4E88_006219 [Alternaria novae-zelandiae]|uniref:uncharacterized protein n=1 Tax=Alternaria novae-zelandiae TaxID=430562 RepID=UPI0020C25D7A|nr:uncharacterized protein J4E88_006219 [Alternaria novae-zelandiae]KAI4678931.1 hypothetical protein J4E88_006219 [Alternaria novae-zelandiae]